MVAATPTDAVCAAGGWLFDRVMAGWDVTVLVARPITGPADERPLQILGATTGELVRGIRTMRPDALAVDVDLFESDQAVRQFVAGAQGDDVTDVRFWGDRDTCLAPAQHRLSVAARAFKAHALAAAGRPADGPEAVEWFCSGDHSRSTAERHAFSGRAG